MHFWGLSYWANNMIHVFVLVSVIQLPKTNNRLFGRWNGKWAKPATHICRLTNFSWLCNCEHVCSTLLYVIVVSALNNIFYSFSNWSAWFSRFFRSTWSTWSTWSTCSTRMVEFFSNHDGGGPSLLQYTAVLHLSNFNCTCCKWPETCTILWISLLKEEVCTLCQCLNVCEIWNIGGL